MKFEKIKKINAEIIHFADNKTIISSKYRTVFINFDEQNIKVKLPEKFIFTIFGLFRIFRRMLRLDKMNVFLHNKNLIIIRRGEVYIYDTNLKVLKKTLKLRNCRNVLHQSINTNKEGYIYFGEYGNNRNRENVPVYCSKDGGNSWIEIYTFPPKTIKHIHGCYYDKYSDRIWVCTGDFENENWLYVADKDFKNIEIIGDGQQKYRACNLIFKEDTVHWLMDSQLEPSYHIVFNRNEKTITSGQKLMGPIWYIKELSDGYYLAATAQEIGNGVLDNKVHLYISNDLKEWKTLQTFNHDGLPKRYFKFGVIGFADGEQSSNEFYMFFEAIKGYDGKSISAKITNL